MVPNTGEVSAGCYWRGMLDAARPAVEVSTQGRPWYAAVAKLLSDAQRGRPISKEGLEGGVRSQSHRKKD